MGWESLLCDRSCRGIFYLIFSWSLVLLQIKFVKFPGQHALDTGAAICGGRRFVTLTHEQTPIAKPGSVLQVRVEEEKGLLIFCRAMDACVCRAVTARLHTRWSVSRVSQAEDDVGADWCGKQLPRSWWRHVDFDDVTVMPRADVANVMWRHREAKQHASSQRRTKVNFQWHLKVIDRDWTQRLIPSVHPEQFTAASADQHQKLLARILYCNHLNQLL